MSYYKYYFLILSLLVGILFSLSENASAQNSPIPHDFETWIPVYCDNIPVYKNLKGYMEIQPRFSFAPAKTEVLLIRPALYYQFPEKFSVGAGYAVIPYFYPNYVLEQRSWQQLLKVFVLNNTTFINRVRLEERYFDNLTGTGIRLRYQLRTLIPIDHQKKWSLAFYDEIFINGNTVTGGPAAGFEQNRLFGGINRQVTKNLAVEIGYLEQSLMLPNAEVPPLNHIVSCATYITF